VRGEEGAAANVVVQVFDHAPGQRQAVVGARAAADLVEMTRLRLLAVLRIRAVSSISTMNVLWPRASSSLAPTRAKIRSATPIVAARAGTNCRSARVA